jgi:hypothetical protein
MFFILPNTSSSSRAFTIHHGEEVDLLLQTNTRVGVVVSTAGSLGRAGMDGESLGRFMEWVGGRRVTWRLVLGVVLGLRQCYSLRCAVEGKETLFAGLGWKSRVFRMEGAEMLRFMWWRGRV